MEQSAKDCGCSPEDFGKQENTVLLSKPLCGAKKYYTQPHFCQFVSYGNGVVAVADEKVYDFVCQYLQSCRYPFYAFDTPHLNQISKEMQKYQKAVCFLAEYFLPDPKNEVITLPGLTIEWLYDQQIEKLYQLAKDRGETLSQLAIQWLWQQKGVTSVLVGVHSKAQLLENLAALEQPPLSEADLIRIDSYSK